MTEDDGKLDLEPVKTAQEAADAKRNANLVKAGIGVAWSIEEGRVVIGALLPEGSAAKSGQLNVGDWIVGVVQPDDRD